MNCAEARGAIGAHLLGSLDEPEQSALFAHLAHCQECAAKHARLSQLVPLIDRAGPGDEHVVLPPQAEERLLARAGRRRRRPALRGFAPALAGALAGAAATLAIVALFGGLRGHSTPALREASSAQLSPTLEAPAAAATAYVINQHGWSTIALEVRGMPVPKPGERYLVWLSDDHASYAVGAISVNSMGWGTTILRRHYATWPGTRISILAAPAKRMNGRARLLVRGTL